MYGISENQFNGFFTKATKLSGVTGENLLALLEKRLDNVVYRMGLADSRSDGRQMVLHGHFLVNGKKAAVPSFLLEKGDVITLSEKGKRNKKIKEISEEKEPATVPGWIEYDPEIPKGTVVREPNREDIDYEVQEQLIVEYYSR